MSAPNHRPVTDNEIGDLWRLNTMARARGATINRKAPTRMELPMLEITRVPTMWSAKGSSPKY